LSTSAQRDNANDNGQNCFHDCVSCKDRCRF
jgi:hypothetical protein